MALGGRARGPRRGGGPQCQAPMRGPRTRRETSRGLTRGRASEAAGHATVASTGLPPPPPSPRPGGQERWQRLIPRRAAAEYRPDSRPDPRSPGPVRTLKRSSRRHELPARHPPAPLLSGLLGAHAQCRRPPRLRALWACACVRARSPEMPAQAHTGASRVVRRPSPTR
jgi:hypothetical protein